MGLFDIFKKKSNSEVSFEQILEAIPKRRKKVDDLLDDLIKSKSSALLGRDEIPGAYGEFGLDASNPVPVEGFEGADIYLHHLTVSCGRELTWKRLGSTASEHIDGMIDIYEPSDQAGNEYPRLFVCMYCDGTSKKIPKGF